MKKVVYAVIVAVVLATSFTACTDENVKPKTNDGGGMGAGIDPKGIN